MLVCWIHCWTFHVFYVLIYDYHLCFNGSPCYTAQYYNSKSVWPNYIVIPIIYHVHVETNNKNQPEEIEHYCFCCT